jgi:phage tail-like protein
LETNTLAAIWLRADVLAQLPESATLELRWAATADEGLRGTLQSIFTDGKRLVGDRIRTITDLLQPYWSRRVIYAGERRDGPAPIQAFALPLHEATGNILWVEVGLHHNQAIETPKAVSLTVHHDVASLLDNLPAIYRGPRGDADGTLRRLVGVIETTTQSIDERIARLADRLDPRRTEDRWLPELASLLGLPFDEALPVAAQRRLVQGALAILAGRGSLAGIHALLKAIFGPRAFMVADRTEQLIPLTLGGGGFAGGSLPSFLSGPSARIPKLNARLVLGTTALCVTDPCVSQSIARPPELLVTIPSTGAERRRYGAAVRRMIEEMIPGGVQLRLRWTAMQPGPATVADDVITIVAEPAPLRLGDGQALGGVRLSSRSRPRLRDGGIPAEHRLS